MSKQEFVESLLKALNKDGKWISNIPVEKPIKRKPKDWKKLSPAQKKEAEAMKKSAFIDALLKGINPIGNTSSGKLVLPGNPETHSGGFKDIDHLEAKKLHEAKAAKHEKKAKNKMLKPGAMFDHKAIAHAQENSAKQREKAEWHGGQVGQEAKPKIPQHEPQKLPGDVQKAHCSICEKKTSFIEKLFKGGPGSGRHKNWTAEDHTKVSEDHSRQAAEAKTQGNQEAYEKNLVEAEKHKMYAADKKLPASATGAKLAKGGPGSGIKGHTTANETDKFVANLALRYESQFYDTFENLVKFLNKQINLESRLKSASEEEAKTFMNSLKKEHAAFLAPSLKKSFTEALLKAGKTGEGSRGGKIVGHTKSGDPIYESAKKDSEGKETKEKEFSVESKPKQLPFPGEDAHKLGDVAKPGSTFQPAGGWGMHYTDYEVSPAHGELAPVGQYKQLIRNLKMMGKDWHGHITFNPESKTIEPLTQQGREYIKEAMTNPHLLEDRAKWTPEQKKG